MMWFDENTIAAVGGSGEIILKSSFKRVIKTIYAKLSRERVSILGTIARVMSNPPG